MLGSLELDSLDQRTWGVTEGIGILATYRRLAKLSGLDRLLLPLPPE